MNPELIRYKLDDLCSIPDSEGIYIFYVNSRITTLLYLLYIEASLPRSKAT
jgi:hypothetical protein